ncbi:MAG: TatD family hydrolase [Methylococcales bacterium]|nr:TatD family hydrolase [Methylococcales bacterium]
MLIDTHCHLDRLDLTPFDGSFEHFLQHCRTQGLEHLLCIAIDLESYPAMVDQIKPYPMISRSVGVHPNVTEGHEPDIDELITLAQQPGVVAIGETGLDYFHPHDVSQQQQRFITHIEAAKQAGKPLIIHTRDAGEDTLALLKQHNASQVGGIIHCFTESLSFAQQAMALGFYISFSGIVTFKNATALQEVARQVPDDRLLIETDSPYLAPVPHRGRPNYPYYVQQVADQVAALRETTAQHIATLNRQNFATLFPTALPSA